MKKSPKVNRYASCTIKVGLLGGSFNPAHYGHLGISKNIKKLLGLDQVWWLVSPRNPLKSEKDKYNFKERFNSALEITANTPYIKVSDIETEFKSNYTFITISKLITKFPHIKFIWLMGADNLTCFHKWNKWRELTRLLPICIYDRGGYCYNKLKSKAGIYMSPNQLNARDLTTAENGFSYLHLKKINISSTLLRQTTWKK